MNVKKFLMVAAVAAAMPFAQAQEAPKAAAPAAPAPAAPAPAAEAPAAEVKIDEAAIDKMLAAIPEVVATFDGGQVYGKEVIEIIRPQIVSVTKMGQKIEAEVIIPVASNYARQLMMQKIVAAEAKAKGFKPDIETVRKQFQEIKAANGEENIKNRLKEMNMTEEQIMEKMAESSMIEAFFRSFVKIDEGAAKKFYDDNPQLFTTYSASHILAMFPGAQQQKMPTPEEEQATLAKLQIAQKELAEGKDFAEVAKAHSDCPSKKDGGNLGTFPGAQMVPEFVAALQNMKPGEISQPVKTPYGYHIIKAGEKKVASFDEVKDAINENLLNQELNKVAGQTIEKLVSEKNGKVLIAPKEAEAPKGAEAPKK